MVSFRCDCMPNNIKFNFCQVIKVILQEYIILLKRSTAATAISTLHMGYLFFNGSIPFLLTTISQQSSEITKKFNIKAHSVYWKLNPLMPNDPYSDCTAPLTSNRCILYIYSTNTGTEYFKHGIYSPFFLFRMQFVS